MVTQQAPQAPNFQQFLKGTRFKTIAVGTQIVNANNDGQTLKFQVPSAGLGLRLWVTIRGTITVAGTSVASGTFQGLPQPVPTSLIKRLRFYSNNNIAFRDISGWGHYKHTRIRSGIDTLAQCPTNFPNFSTSNLAKMGLNSTGNSAVQAAAVALSTYNVNWCFPIDLAYNQLGEVGLIQAQSNSVFYYLDLTMGQISSGLTSTGGSNDFFNALVGVGLTVTPALTVKVGYEYCDYTPDAEPFLGYFMGVSEQNQTLIQNENTILIPPHDLYTGFITEMTNNGAAATMDQISNVTLQHSGGVFPIQTYDETRAIQSYMNYGLVPQDGIVAFDLGCRGGVLRRRDLYDALLGQQITDLKIKQTFSSAVTGVNTFSLITEYLDKYAQ